MPNGLRHVHVIAGCLFFVVSVAAPAQLPEEPPPPVMPEEEGTPPAPGDEPEWGEPPDDDTVIAEILEESVTYGAIREAVDGDFDADEPALAGMRVTLEHRKLEGLIRERLKAHYADKWGLSVDEDAVEERARRMRARAPAAQQVAESLERERQVIIAAQAWLAHRDDPEAAYEEHVSDFLTREGWRRQVREFEEQGVEETKRYLAEAEARFETLSPAATREQAKRDLLREKLEDEIADRAGVSVSKEEAAAAYERLHGEAPPEDWIDSDAAQRIRRALETEEAEAAQQQFWAEAFAEHVRIRHARFADLARRFRQS